MKKLLVILCLLLCGCVKTAEPIKEDIQNKEHEVTTSTDSKQEVIDAKGSSDTDTENTEEKDLSSLIHNETDQKAYELFEEMTSIRYDNAVFTANFDDQQVQMQSFDENQIIDFFSLLKKGTVMSLSESKEIKKEDLKIDIIASNGFNEHIHCQFVFNQGNPLLLLLDSPDEYQITFERSMYDLMYNYLPFLNLGTTVAFEEVDNYEQQFIGEADITRDYHTMDYLFKEAIDTDEGLIRKSFGDGYGWDKNDMNRTLALLFYTKEYSMAPDFNEDIFKFIILNNEFMEIIDGDVEPLSVISYMQDGIKQTITLDKAIPGYSILMNGKDFRAAYQQLFDTEMKWDESASYHAGPLGGDRYGYFADYDLYYFSRYCIGAYGGYVGWNFLIENMEETSNILTIDLLDFYTSFDWLENGNYIKLYDKDWQPISAGEISWTEGAKLADLIPLQRDRFQQWQVKLLHREDGSYALLSAQCLNKKTAPIKAPLIEIIKKPITNYSSSDAFLMPQFTLSGLDAFLINKDIESGCSKVRGHLVEEDTDQVIVKSIDRYPLPFKDAYIYYVKQAYTYDKNQNAFINAEKILSWKPYY